MKLYNTLSRQTDQLEPLSDSYRVYSCGPTVYDNIHIGNLSSFIFADTLRRTLLSTGVEVKHVMNFTDVDDKTISRSKQLYLDMDAMDALLKLTADCSEAFLTDMELVGNDVAAVTFVKATDSIEAMQQLIRELHAGGFAYIADDGIYFSIAAYKKAGKVYGQLTEVTTNSTSASRIQNDEYDKESAHDFALWKKQKTGEPAWSFELDGQSLTGRPGWHLECSAMSKTTLGQPFDIHTGGVDLIFPHHENEIAQSTATQDSPVYSNVFAHNEHLLIDGKKMSKSLDNFYTIKDIAAKGFDPLAFRLLVLQAHYRKQAHFSWENLEAAQNRLNAYRALADLRWQTIDSAPEFDYQNTQKRILKQMHSDLDTPTTLAFLSELEKTVTEQLVKSEDKDAFITFLRTMDALLGLQLSNRPNITNEQGRLIRDRQEARANKDWATSDQLRDKLTKHGVGVRDTTHGSIWFRT